MGRLLAVGDIHGYKEKLEALMGIVQPTPEDRIVFLGDYIDRGKDSPGVIEYLIAIGKEYPRTIFLGGNHDHLFVSMLIKKGRLPVPSSGGTGKAADYPTIADIPSYQDFQAIFYSNGGISTMSQYHSFEAIPASHIDFLAGLRLYYEADFAGRKFFFVHAGLRPCVLLKNQTAEDLLWIRDEEAYQGKIDEFEGRVVVRGHSYDVKVPVVAPYLVNLDSGVYLNPQGNPNQGVLTCCDVVTREIWQV